MKKKASRKKTKTGKKDTGSQGNEHPGTDKSTGPDQSFDFGGLPQRDLKKNLGCG
jgi:hypothetical protein